ncbi:MAG: protein kinase [Ktedonobacteraceae bacterium]
MQDNSNYVGNYELLQEIGRGSFGIAYLVQHRFIPDRIAVMKLLHASRLHATTEQEKFLREAHYLGILHHPHILAILDAGIDEGIPYIVTEYAPNGSLRDLLHRYSLRPLSPKRAIAIVSQIGYALHYAHLQGIIHHDIKPENILFNDRGDALLADFGIAMMQESIQRQRSAASMGTPMYMAPERFQGYVSKRSDQYSLGCVLYELLAGRPPFTAPNAIALGVQHARTRPVPPSHFNARVPAYVEQAVLRTLEKRRMNRFDGVLSFVEAIQGSPLSQPEIVEPTLQSRPMQFHTGHKTKEEWLNAGIALRATGAYQEALLADERAILLDPSCAKAYNGKGNSFYSLKRYNEALAAYERAILLNAHDAYAHNNKGLVLSVFGHYAEALACFEQAIHIDNTQPNFYHNKGLTLQHLGRERVAQQAFFVARQLRQQ